MHKTEAIKSQEVVSLKTTVTGNIHQVVTIYQTLVFLYTLNKYINIFVCLAHTKH